MSVKYLKKIRQILASRSHPYRTSLNALIKRCENRMKISPKCPFCGGPMVFRRSIISGAGFGSYKGTPIRDDQAWKCTGCFHVSGFGVPISKCEAEKDVYLRGGRMLCISDYRVDEAKRTDIRRRLEQLGYFDFGD